MKKGSKTKEPGVQETVEADIAGLIVRVMQQLTFLDKKIDTLISQAVARPAEPRNFPAPFQHSGRHERHDQPRQDFRERVLHKAVCADCSKECEVPFKPTGNRPVYCKECFSRRKDDSPFKGRRDERPVGGESHHKAPFYKKYAGKNARSGAKKRPIVRGRRKPKE